MIWTDYEDTFRAMDTMTEPGGKSCANCHWGDADIKEDNPNGWTVCGHHCENFKTESLCAYWTDPNDPKLKEYLKNRGIHNIV